MVLAEQRRCLKRVPFLSEVATLRKVTVNFVMSFCPPALNKPCPRWKNFCEILYVGLFFVKICRQSYLLGSWFLAS
jgi:hypothetical protein